MPRKEGKEPLISLFSPIKSNSHLILNKKFSWVGYRKSYAASLWEEENVSTNLSLLLYPVWGPCGTGNQSRPLASLTVKLTLL